MLARKICGLPLPGVSVAINLAPVVVRRILYAEINPQKRVYYIGKMEANLTPDRSRLFVVTGVDIPLPACDFWTLVGH